MTQFGHASRRRIVRKLRRKTGGAKFWQRRHLGWNGSKHHSRNSFFADINPGRRAPFSLHKVSPPSQPCTIVWSEDTDSAVAFAELQTMLVSSDAKPSGSAHGSSRQSNGAARRHAPHPPAPPPPAPVPNLDIFTGLPSSPEDDIR